MQSPSLQTTGHIHSVETCGTVDGPGLRYVLFTSGCPLRCLYCHNADSQQLSGNIKTAEEIVQDVLRYRNFIKRGGLTISGGEPLMQPDFVHAIFKGAKAHGIHTVLDTSGFFNDKTSNELLNEVDLVLLDIKSWNPDTYKRVTGVDISSTLKFARRLSSLNKPAWIRFVLVPGLTDDPDNIEGLARFVRTLKNVERVEILPFHKMGEHKFVQLGMPYELADTRTPNAYEVQAVQRIFTSYGIKTV